MSKGLNTGLKSNEELVIAYRETRNEAYLQELISQNTGLLNTWANSYVNSIPKAEQEDLVSESYIPMLRAIEDFDAEAGVTFASFLKVYVRQHFNRLYNEATRQKRYAGYTPVSYESLVEINKESGEECDSSFTVECEDMRDVEFRAFLNSIDLNFKEQVAVNVLMAGGSKGEVAKLLNCTPATANYYFKSIRKKFVFAGVCV